MKKWFILLLLGLSGCIMQGSRPPQPSELRTLSPEAKDLLDKAKRAAIQNKDPESALALLERDDPALVAAGGGFLAEYLEPEDLALVVKEAEERKVPQRHLILPLLVLVPSVPGINFLVDHLASLRDSAQQIRVGKLLAGITGENFQTPGEWKSWWDKESTSYVPTPWDPSRAGERMKILADRLELEPLAIIPKNSSSTNMPLSVAAENLIWNLRGPFSETMEEVEKDPRAALVKEALEAFRKGDFAEADHVLTLHLDQSPRDVYALFFRASARANSGNLVAANSDLALILRLEPDATNARIFLELNRILERQPQLPLVEAYWQVWHKLRPEEAIIFNRGPILKRIDEERSLDLPTYKHPGGEAIRRRFTEHASDPALATGFALLLPKDEIRPALDDVLDRHPNYAEAKYARLERLMELHSGTSTALLEEARTLLINDPDNLLLQLYVVDQEGKFSLPERVWSREERSPMPSNTWTRLVAVAEGKGRWPTRSKALLDLQRRAAQQAGWVFLEISGPEFLNNKVGLLTLFRRAMATVKIGCPRMEALAVAALAERMADGIRSDRNGMFNILVAENYRSLAQQIQRLVDEQSKHEGDSTRLAQLKSERLAHFKHLNDISIAFPEEQVIPFLALQQAFRDFRQTRDSLAEWEAYEEFRKSLPKK